MTFEKYDRVIYINNNAYDDNVNLLKRPVGTIIRIFPPYVGCSWKLKNGEEFCWNVPLSYVRLSKENK